MTPQQLAELPVGTKIRMHVGNWLPLEQTYEDVWDYAIITNSGVICHLLWMDGAENIIPTLSKPWEMFIAELYVVEAL